MFFHADFCTEDADHVHTDVGMKLKPEVIKTESGAESISGKSHPCLHCSPGSLCSDPEAKMTSAQGANAWHGCCSTSCLCTGIKGFKWGWHLLSFTNSTLGWPKRIPAPAVQLDGCCVHKWAPDIYSPGCWADLLHSSLIHKARSSGKVVTNSGTSSG